MKVRVRHELWYIDESGRRVKATTLTEKIDTNSLDEAVAQSGLRECEKRDEKYICTEVVAVEEDGKPIAWWKHIFEVVE